MFWIYPPVKYFGSRKKDKCSMPQMDKNRYILPTSEGKIRQQKSRLLKSGFLNGRGGGIPLRYFS